MRVCNRMIFYSLLAAPLTAATLNGQSLDVSRCTIDGGGALHSFGGIYSVSGTVGQPDAGAMSGGVYAVTGGFWFPLAAIDGNEDGAVDLVDFDAFHRCLLGPVGGLDTGCSQYDSDGSGHVDLRDFAALQSLFTGST